MKKDKIYSAIFVILIFTICLVGAILIPADMCPDELGRRQLTDWIVRTGKLPTGNEEGTVLIGWGFSYAVRPYLTSIIGAFFVKIVSLFTTSDVALWVAARMCSILSVTVCGIYCIKIGKICFKKLSSSLLMATLVCFIPQVLFLGMYINNDSLSLCAISMMVYYLAKGQQDKWTIKTCIGLGVSFSIGLLSYYNIYGWLLMGGILFLISMIKNKDIENKKSYVIKRLTIVAGICIVLSGWFFVRNGIHHNGDFIGISVEKIMRAKYSALGFKLYPYRSLKGQGYPMNLFDSAYGPWWRFTIHSFIGGFGYMTIWLPTFMYNIYECTYALGILLFFYQAIRKRIDKEKIALSVMMLISSIINFGLFFWQSYFRDNQPQGRYIIGISVLLAFIITCAIDQIDLNKLKIKNTKFKKLANIIKPAYILMALWIVLFIISTGTMKKMLG